MDKMISTTKVAKLVGYTGDMSGFRRKLRALGIKTEMGTNRIGNPMCLWSRNDVLAKYDASNTTPEAKPTKKVTKSDGSSVNVTKLRIAEPMIDLPQFARMCGVTNINVSILERYGIHPVATKAIGQKRLVNLYLKSDADRYNAEISLASKRTKKESEVVSDKDTSVSKAELVALIMKMNARLDAIENGIANVLP